ncbi:MAG: TetR/AcrR family transcriptional regulator [Clostridia bacterium]|nr:TetR/AcrR family transcriptional regulator [Clostridia bacterium]
MSTRGDNSKNKILNTARPLFAKMGYSRVTMQDICVASGFSRGGLYRHYSSKEQILEAIIKKDEEDALDFLANAVKNNVSPEDMLLTFLKIRIDMHCDPENSIENAVMEFAQSSDDGKKLLQNRATVSIAIVKEMLEYGCADGSFKCSDHETLAKMILWTLEGIGKHNLLIPLTQEEKEKVVLFIYDSIK